MNPEIPLTNEMKQLAYNFARMIEEQNNQYPRLGQNLEELIETTYIGKLGELAFLEYLRNNNIFPNVDGMLEIFEGQENVDQYDFQLRDFRTVDIKTGYLDFHSRLMVNAEQLDRNPKDIYIGVKLHANGYHANRVGAVPWDAWTSATINGYATSDALSNVQPRNFGRGIAYALRYDELDDVMDLIHEF